MPHNAGWPEEPAVTRGDGYSHINLSCPGYRIIREERANKCKWVRVTSEGVLDSFTLQEQPSQELMTDLTGMRSSSSTTG